MVIRAAKTEKTLWVTHSSKCFNSANNPKWQVALLYFLFIYVLFSFGCVGSSLLLMGFLQLWRAGATLHCGAWVSHCGGLSCCGAWALGTRAQQLWLEGSRAQAQQLWRKGLVAPQHVGSSQTRARTCVPCIGRQILNHCAVRKLPVALLLQEKPGAPKCQGVCPTILTL